MSGATDNSEYAFKRATGQTATLKDLLDHLDAMGDYEIGIGETNAAAARHARWLLAEVYGEGS